MRLPEVLVIYVLSIQIIMHLIFCRICYKRNEITAAYRFAVFALITLIIGVIGISLIYMNFYT